MIEREDILNSAELQIVCDLVYKEAAIVLDDTKSYLIEARLEPLAKREGFASSKELVANLKKGGSASLIDKAVDAMTTNETSFFRDIHPFVTLRKHILPEIIARKEDEKTLNIWCAAASSGQEPYTVALILKEHFPQLHDWNISFIATDISEEMLKRCREGKFSKLEVNRGLPAPMLVKYFRQEGADWFIREDIRSMIEFRPLNLIGSWPFMPRMDIVFIRNVLIYFDQPTKRSIFKNIRGVMDPDGFMFLGGAETTLNLDDAFHRIRIEKSTCYTLTAKDLAEMGVSA